MSLTYKKVELGGLFIALLTLVLAVDIPSPLRASAHGLVD